MGDQTNTKFKKLVCDNLVKSMGAGPWKEDKNKVPDGFETMASQVLLGFLTSNSEGTHGWYRLFSSKVLRHVLCSAARIHWKISKYFIQEHPTTFFCKMTVGRNKCCLEFLKLEKVWELSDNLSNVKDVWSFSTYLYTYDASVSHFITEMMV